MAKKADKVANDDPAQELPTEPAGKRGKKPSSTKSSEPAPKKPRKSTVPDATDARKVVAVKKGTAKAKAAAAVGGQDSGSPAAEGPKKRAQAVRETFPRSPIAEHPLGKPPGCFKIITWNVTTLRSLIDKKPDLLLRLYKEQAPDLLLVQETKLNEGDVADYEKKLAELLPGHSFYFSTSTGRKSYAGTLAVVKDAASSAGKKQALPGTPPAESGDASIEQATIDHFFAKSAKAGAPGGGGGGESGPAPLGVTYGLPTMTDADGPDAKEAALEGRTITLEYPTFFVVGVYVPNSGDKLQRLDFRVKVWDRRLEQHLQALEANHNKPVILCGDLNVAHLDEDIWNAGAKHLATSAGTTPEERASFGRTLDLGFVDAFRRQHGPSATGWFSYFSVRAGNLPVNRGLRLDYFVCSPSLFPRDGVPAQGAPAVTGTTILPDFVAIDHAACALTLRP